MADDQEQDMVLVNPGGRLVEVSYELGQELLAQGAQAGEKPFRVASDSEVKDYRKGVQSIAPAILAKQEEKRLAAEKQAAEDYFKGLNGEPTGAQPAAQSAQDATAQEPSGTTEAGQPADDKPKSRKSK